MRATRGPGLGSVERATLGSGRQRYVTPEKRLDMRGIVKCEGRDFEDLVVQVLSAGHALRFRARGSSMYPLVRDGDILDVWPVDHAVIDVGDIILYRSPSRGIVVHRVVNTRSNGQDAVFAVKGDAARAPDPEVLESQVLGKVVGIQRRGHTILPGSWTSRHVTPLQARFYRLRRWVDGALKEAWRGLRRVAGIAGQEA